MSNTTGEKYLKTKFAHPSINEKFYKDDNLSTLKGQFLVER
jgi:hypothetical protein